MADYSVTRIGTGATDVKESEKGADLLFYFNTGTRLFSCLSLYKHLASVAVAYCCYFSFFVLVRYSILWMQLSKASV